MEKNQIKYLIVAAIVLVCGLIWVFTGDERAATKDDMTDIFEEQTTEPETKEKKDGDSGKIYVHITGAVKKPGVYIFDEKPRVVEVVEKAGGFRKDAVQSEINQAEIIEDGAQIVIESKKDKIKAQKEQKRIFESKEDSDLLNINTATKEELMTLTGIGESKAMSIISYRETHGEFKKIEDIMNITGIKTGVFEKIKNQIRV